MDESSAGSSEDEAGETYDLFSKPLVVAVAGATAYWLEDQSGRRIGEVSGGTGDLLAEVLAASRRGEDLSGVRLVCLIPGEGYVTFVGGEALVHLAEWTSEVVEERRAKAAKAKAAKARRAKAAKAAKACRRDPAGQY
jgi:hypothetical protein